MSKESGVIHLSKVSIKADEELVQRLEDILELAKKGELVSFHGVGMMVAGDILSTTGPFKDLAYELGALEILRFRMVSRGVGDE